jgi:hypothetical protein
MSKLADKLKQCYQNTTPSIGFRKSDSQEQALPMAVITDFTNSSEKGVQNMIKSGIDAAVINSSNLNATMFKKLLDNMGDVPLGILSDNNDQKEIAATLNLPCDFIILDLKAPLEAINNEKPGKFLKLNKSVQPNIIRAINEITMPVDGIVITSEDPVPTIEYLLICKSFTELVNKPVLIETDASLKDAELVNLYESGVNGLILRGEVSGKRITELKIIISELPKRTRKKGQHSVLLPKLESTARSEIDEDEIEDI